MADDWFKVDKDGFRAMQSGKPKHYAVRELIQNALDEDVTQVLVDLYYGRGNLSVSVTDNGAGFESLKDAYTLFADTYKRPDPTKRGRFNMGEKQAFSICKHAKIETTKGTIVFDEKGRRKLRQSRESGTKVTILMTKVTRDEYNQIQTFIQDIIVPDGIEMIVNGVAVTQEEPVSIFEAILPTEFLNDNNEFRKSNRKTRIEVYQKGVGDCWLYEMGIPVCPVDCSYELNVMQRIPMSVDRDKVSQSYLRHLYAEVLNHTHVELDEDNVSDTWVRLATTDADRISQKALVSVKEKRWGDKVASVNPQDPLAKDDAIADGCRVVHGSELSPDEWDAFKPLIQSTTQLYGRGTAEYCDSIEELTTDQQRFESLVHKIVKTTMAIPGVSIEFVKSDATHGGWYDKEIHAVTFNVARLSKNFFERSNFAGQVDLILHELAHEYGHHTEKGYHQAISNIAGQLIECVVKNPSEWAIFAN